MKRRTLAAATAVLMASTLVLGACTGEIVAQSGDFAQSACSAAPRLTGLVDGICVCVDFEPL